MAVRYEDMPGLMELLNQKFDKLTNLVETFVKVEPKPEPDDVRLYGDRELADYLSCNVQTIYRLKKAGKLPIHKYGRKYYYLRSEIDTAFAGKRSIK